jgi:DHA1 family tetracycline resistance protein-like MFS transporter
MAKNTSTKEPKPPSSPERREMFMRLGLLSIAVLIDLLGFSIIIPLIPYFVIGGLHLTGSAAASDPNVGRLGAWIVACYAGMQFIFAPIWGRLSDKVGRKPILIMSLIGDAVFYTMFGMSEHSLPLMFASRILAGIFSSASISVAQAYVADVTPPEYRAAGLGHLGAAFGVGFILGPMIGGVLGHFNLGLPLYFASAMAIINAIYIQIKLPEPRSAEQRANASENESVGAGLTRLSRMLQGLSGATGFLFLLTFLVTLAFSQLEGTFTSYLVQKFHYTKSTSTSTAGYVFGYIGLILVLIQGGAIRPLTKRFGETPLVLAGIFCMAVGFCTFALAGSLSMLMFGPMLPICVGVGLNNPSLRALISKRASADTQGAQMGIASSFDSLARFLGPALAGELYNALGPASPYWSAGIFMTIAFLFALSQKSKLPSVGEIIPAIPASAVSETGN